MKGWIGVDLDGTLARYDGWKGADHIGEPIPAMVERVKQWLAEGKDVRIFTARVWFDQLDYLGMVEAVKIRNMIQDWTECNIGMRLEVTNIKDRYMIELWDDRAVRVVQNFGCPCCGAHNAK